MAEIKIKQCLISCGQEPRFLARLGDSVLVVIDELPSFATIQEMGDGWVNLVCSDGVHRKIADSQIIALNIGD